MRIVISATVLVLAGCTSIADLRDDQPFMRLASNHSAETVIACVVEQWADRSGTVNVLPRTNGSSANLSYQGALAAAPTVAALVDAQNTDTGSEIVVYKRGGESSDKLRGEVEPCI